MNGHNDNRTVHDLFADALAGIFGGLHRRVENNFQKRSERRTREIIENLPTRIQRDIGWR